MKLSSTTACKAKWDKLLRLKAIQGLEGEGSHRTQKLDQLNFIRTILLLYECSFPFTSTFFSLRALSMSLVVNLRLFPWRMNFSASYGKGRKKGLKPSFLGVYRQQNISIPVQFLLFGSWLLHSEQHSFLPVTVPLQQTLPWPSWTPWAGRPNIASAVVLPPWLTKVNKLVNVTSIILYIQRWSHLL